jgi:hypothetical protein
VNGLINGFASRLLQGTNPYKPVRAVAHAIRCYNGKCGAVTHARKKLFALFECRAQCVSYTQPSTIRQEVETTEVPVLVGKHGTGSRNSGEATKRAR